MKTRKFTAIASLSFALLFGSAGMNGEHEASAAQKTTSYKTYCYYSYNTHSKHCYRVVHNAGQQQNKPSNDGQVQNPVEKPEQAPTEKPVEKPSEETSQVPASVSAYEKEVVTLTNKERTDRGLKALTIDSELSKVARVKSEDMQKKNYFSHTSPTYGSPFDMMKQFGVTYKSAGENIAKGQKTPKEVVNAWMNSEGHRANILNGSFTHIGVGYVSNGSIWTQQFIGK